jgi:integrase
MREWMNSIRRPCTRNNYVWAMESFSAFVELTPQEIRASRIVDLANPDILAQGGWESKVKEWYNQLQGAPRSRALKYFAIRSFFKKCIVNSKGELGDDLIQVDKHRVKPPGKLTLAEVKTLCEISSIRTRALILWELKTGCRPETTAGVRMMDIDMTQGYPWVVYPKQSKSSDTGYITFCDEEGGEAMLLYWKYRGFGDEASLPIFTAVDLATKKSTKTPISPPDISGAITRVITKAKQEKRVRQEIRAYGLRKLFQTQMEAAKVSSNWVKRMMCHSVGDVEGAYSQADLDQMREAYRSVVDGGWLQVFAPVKPEFSDSDKTMMKAILDAVKVTSPKQFEKIRRTETLGNGTPNLLRTVMREM